MDSRMANVIASCVIFAMDHQAELKLKYLPYLLGREDNLDIFAEPEGYLQSILDYLVSESTEL
jgi:hypothetical protein